jgi:hypothetical protein
MILETTLALLLSASAPAAHSQKERCATSQSSGEMKCVNRLGHCMELTVDGQKTVALNDEAAGKRANDIKHGQDVCWQLTQPVSSTLRVSAKAGGLFPSFLGKIEKIEAHVYPLDDYDPKVDSRLDQLNEVRTVADGDPNGTWHVTSEHPLKAGDYVVVFQVFGVGNWDRQAVLLKLDPKATPGAIDKIGGGK